MHSGMYFNLVETHAFTYIKSFITVDYTKYEGATHKSCNNLSVAIQLNSRDGK
jgi:hypothetical protein